jgi:hypothetical protein
MTAAGDDVRAILKVIEEESAAFWNKDFEAFARHWVHEPYARHMGWWSRGGITAICGWREIGMRMKWQMEQNPEPNPTARAVRRENVNIRVGADIAWVTFDQHGLETGDRRMDMPGLSHETRILEKHDGVWKIAYAGWLLVGPDEEVAGPAMKRKGA